MAGLILRGGRVVDPASGRDAMADIAFADGRVSAIGPELRPDGADIVDLGGLIVAPGLVGATGDATILEMVKGDFAFRDVLGEERRGRCRLEARGLVVAGRWWHPPRP